MIAPGKIVLFNFPQTNLQAGKMRPALVIAKVPGRYDDWLTSAISTQLHQQIPDFDEVIKISDDDYSSSGLKTESLIRVGRLGVLESSVFEGAIGQISEIRLNRIKSCLAKWVME
jgi:mRNA interferase MazF